MTAIRRTARSSLILGLAHLVVLSFASSVLSQSCLANQESGCGETGIGVPDPFHGSGGKNDSTASSEGMVREVEDVAILLSNLYKRLHRSDDSLGDWEADRFAYEDGRAADFEAMRMDEIPCDYSIPHLDVGDLTSESFRDTYEREAKPVMLKNIPELMNWNASTKWTLEGLKELYPHVSVKVGRDDDGYDLKMSIAEFLRYAEVQKDDSPLYVFDTHFVKGNVGKMMKEDYEVPFLFPEDLFSCLGDARPPFRWFLIGPKRSGSSVHVDPLSTSAWNTLLSGRKLWVLSPPGTLRALRGLPPRKGKDGDPKRKEAIRYFIDDLPRIRDNLKGKVEVTVLVQHPGETIFVPAGWAHGVLNLDDTVAITQNFVSSQNFDEVWKTTRKERPNFATRWLQRLLPKHPHLVHRALEMNRVDKWDAIAAQEDGDSRDDYDEIDVDDSSDDE